METQTYTVINKSARRVVHVSPSAVEFKAEITRAQASNALKEVAHHEAIRKVEAMHRKEGAVPTRPN